MLIYAKYRYIKRPGRRYKLLQYAMSSLFDEVELISPVAATAIGEFVTRVMD